ncbi:glutathione-regulated potassium-efflux system protein KefC [Streptococcus criceti]|uniref:Membrane protein n=1 Tax=Streptococcus criceti HS-6 TaxID=873449 RepID=G5JTX2_STRCG|nr:cation:proton antiporter [Streptococcus criceti]EHI75131.1 putative membrane protein [Streptococcus criceti HS-6]SUN37786.1 glutathione-regulated potassium-efflux system protein KefC [Streptococcus criceti]
MIGTFISLTLITFIAAVTPMVARLIPRQVVPETVILIAAGAVFGPHALNLIHSDSEALELLSDLGCAFLFLLAGYEIDPKVIVGKEGKKGFGTWVVTFAIGLGVAFIMPDIASGKQGLIATALLFTTTALGTLMPILEERGLTGTQIGNTIIAYGTWGEVSTVIAMAVLLSARSTWKTAAILGGLLLICIWLAALGNKAVQRGGAMYQFLHSKSDTNSQMTVRVTILLLIVLVAFSAIFDLDIVLGAFAAGFVLRFVIPENSHTLEKKINGIAHGFLIPLFFVISGCGINLTAVADRPWLLVAFILALFLIRAVPIVLSLSLEKDTEQRLTLHNRFSVAFYCTTALPLIVGITGIAVKDDFMTSDIASVLVAAGAITVFLMPYFGALTYTVVDAEPISAVREIFHSPRDITTILNKHFEQERERARQYQDYAAKRIAWGLDTIQNPEERQEMRDLLVKNREEIQDFHQEQLELRKDLYAKHTDAIKEVYQKYHNGQLPNDHFLRILENRRYQRDDESTT